MIEGMNDATTSSEQDGTEPYPSFPVATQRSRQSISPLAVLVLAGFLVGVIVVILFLERDGGSAGSGDHWTLSRGSTNPESSIAEYWGRGSFDNPVEWWVEDGVWHFRCKSSGCRGNDWDPFALPPGRTTSSNKPILACRTQISNWHGYTCQRVGNTPERSIDFECRRPSGEVGDGIPERLGCRGPEEDFDTVSMRCSVVDWLDAYDRPSLRIRLTSVEWYDCEAM